MLLAHISDIHFGRIAHPRIVDALISEVNDRGVDLVVASGDLTQRAKLQELKDAKQMLDSFAAPRLVVPGNHDVYAWWFGVNRMVHPLRRYSRYIDDELSPSFETDSAAVLGINSAIGLTIAGGHIGQEQLDRMRDYFSEVDPAKAKILVVHHHLTKLEEIGRHDVARNATTALHTAADVGVDMILCGHLHISHIEPVEIIPDVHRVIVVSAGTATSDRGRRVNRKCNFFNFITVNEDSYEVEERQFDPSTAKFFQSSSTTLSRLQNGVGW